MESGKLYLVIYKDDHGQSRDKKLTFIKSEDGLLFFTNPWSKLEEVIGASHIVRIEERRENGGEEQ